MPFTSFPDEIWLLIFEYCLDLSQCVRIWIAFGLTRTIGRQHMIWQQLLERYFRRQHKDIERVLNMIATPIDSFLGLDLYARLHSRKKCSRSGCFQVFRHVDNYDQACRYHSGKMKSNKTLSCCRASSFSAKGCKRGWHDASFFEMVYRPREKTESKESKAMDERESSVLILPHIQSPPGTQERLELATNLILSSPDNRASLGVETLPDIRRKP